MQKEYSCLRIYDEDPEISTCMLAEEVALTIFVNGRNFMTAMISPEMKKEFVIGHLFSEGIVGSQKEIESLEIDGDVVRVIIKNPLKTIVSRRTIVSGCGGSSSFLRESRLPKIPSDLKIGRDLFFDAIKTISLSQLHKATGGVHSVGIFQKSETICVVEDIGRHNALDKAIGHGLEGDVDFGKTFVASTGRISSDMAMKCSTAGIPIIISRGATTSLAVDIAERTGLAIIGFVRGKRMNVYSNSWRVAGSSQVEEKKPL